MSPWLLLLLQVVHAQSPVLTTLGASGQYESLSRPAGTTWTEISLFALARTSQWHTGASTRGIERFEIRDAEGSIWAGLDQETLGWEIGATKGLEERFLPTWGAWGSVRGTLRPGWSSSFAIQTSVYPEMTAVQPKASLEHYLAQWRLELQGSGMLADDTFVGAGGQVLAEYSWSDEGSATGLVGTGAEAERWDDGSLVTTRVTSLSVGLRQRIASQTTLRGSVGWIRQGPWHDRAGLSLGLAHEFGR